MNRHEMVTNPRLVRALRLRHYQQQAVLATRAAATPDYVQHNVAREAGKAARRSLRVLVRLPWVSWSAVDPRADWRGAVLHGRQS